MKAVIPAAGMGTRFLPATKNSPKEMLPLVDKPTIQHVVEEAVASGITDILIITGRGKRAVEDHFDRNFELEHPLERKGDAARLEEVRRIAEMADIHYVRQREPKGLGHAILCAEKHMGGEPFAVLLGDDVVVSRTPCTRQLMDCHARTGASVIAVERMPMDQIESYGVVKPGRAVDDHLREVEALVEKPRRAEAPSDLAILGRYVLTPAVFDELRRTPPGRNGEIQLTDALQRLRAREPIYALEFEGRRHDLGDKLGWLKSNVEVALGMPEFREPLLEFLRKAVADRRALTPASPAPAPPPASP
ncbi:MAG TPA: UTP--glucose-1-phosphate uridylyltransferase GalU [Candidatus Thermoplasmatota archaeon]|nr:UTP--glucose-1-phosphate uridylyltransferase GalU [Candidatus Thermoplasmatota archaeon]